jgi:hypothetical protein
MRFSPIREIAFIPTSPGIGFVFNGSPRPRTCAGHAWPFGAKAIKGKIHPAKHYGFDRRKCIVAPKSGLE